MILTETDTQREARIKRQRAKELLECKARIRAGEALLGSLPNDMMRAIVQLSLRAQGMCLQYGTGACRTEFKKWIAAERRHLARQQESV